MSAAGWNIVGPAGRSFSIRNRCASRPAEQNVWMRRVVLTLADEGPVVGYWRKAAVPDQSSVVALECVGVFD
jgi:hypothetical protein